MENDYAIFNTATGALEASLPLSTAKTIYRDATHTAIRQRRSGGLQVKSLDNGLDLLSRENNRAIGLVKNAARANGLRGVAAL